VNECLVFSNGETIPHAVDGLTVRYVGSGYGEDYERVMRDSFGLEIGGLYVMRDCEPIHPEIVLRGTKGTHPANIFNLIELPLHVKVEVV